MAFIAGGYTATLVTNAAGNTVNLGLGQIDKGITLRSVIHAEDITGDTYANTIQDGVYLGRNATVSFTLKEANRTAVQWLIEPYVAAANRISMEADFGRIEIPGYLLSNFFSYVRLNKVTGPNSTPNIFHFEKCALTRDFPVEMLLAPNLKQYPIQLTLYPFTTSGRNYLFRVETLTLSDT